MKPDHTLTLDDSERQPCEVWTRVMGYHRPVSAFNPGKHQEHEDRVHFQELPQAHADRTSHASPHPLQREEMLQ